MNLYRRIVIAVLLLLATCQGFAQLQISHRGGKTPAEILAEGLLGSGVTVTNVRFNGTPVALGSGDNRIGIFSNGNNSGIDIDSGLIIATGNIQYAATNNINKNVLHTQYGYDRDGGYAYVESTCWMPIPGGAFAEGVPATTGISDADVAAQIGIDPKYLYSCSVLEFDFVPSSDTVQFRYIFASEEYPTYVGCQWNDVFGFFISSQENDGFNYSSKNIALIPGTNYPVCINNVNIGNTHCLWEVDPNTGIWYSYTGTRFDQQIADIGKAYYVENTSAYFEYDGYTKVLTALAQVKPCATYTMKLVIADVGDDLFDSAVLLEAKSFSSTHYSSSVTPVKERIDAEGMVEGCNDVIIHFYSSNTEKEHQIDLNLITLSDTLMATEGSDFDEIPRHLTIPIGVDSIEFRVSAKLDAEIEPTEYIAIAYQSTTCEIDTIIIPIYDNTNIVTAEIRNHTFECQGADTLFLEVHGGYTPLNISWKNTQISLDTNNAVLPLMMPVEADKYYVHVEDACGNIATDTIDVVYKPHTTEYHRYDTLVCKGFSPVGISYLSDDIIPTTYTVSPRVDTTEGKMWFAKEGEYILTLDNVCRTVYDTFMVKQDVATLTLSPAKPVICYGDSTLLTATAVGENCPDGWWYSFDGADFSALNTKQAKIGRHEVEIRCANQQQTICRYKEHITIQKNPVFATETNITTNGVCHSPVPDHYDLTAHTNIAGGDIKWYADMELTNLLHTGTDFSIGKLLHDTIFYITTSSATLCGNEPLFAKPYPITLCDARFLIDSKINQPYFCGNDTIKITITITNLYDVVGTNLLLSDVLPESVKFLDATGVLDGKTVHGKYNASSHTVSLYMEEFPATQHECTFTIRCVAYSGITGLFDNKAELYSRSTTAPVQTHVGFGIRIVNE